MSLRDPIRLNDGELYSDECGCCDPQTPEENCSCVDGWVLPSGPEVLNIIGVVRGISNSLASRFVMEYSLADGGSSYEAWINGGTFDDLSTGYHFHGTRRDATCLINDPGATSDSAQAFWGNFQRSGFGGPYDPLPILAGFNEMTLKSNIGFGTPMRCYAYTKGSISFNQSFPGIEFAGTPSACSAIQTYYANNPFFFNNSHSPFVAATDARIMFKNMGLPVVYPQDDWPAFEFIPQPGPQHPFLPVTNWLLDPASVIKYDVIIHTGAHGSHYLSQQKEIDRYEFKANGVGPSYDVYYPEWGTPGVKHFLRYGVSSDWFNWPQLKFILWSLPFPDREYVATLDTTYTTRQTFTHTSSPFQTWSYPSRVSVQSKFGITLSSPTDTATVEWVPIT